MLLNIKNVYFSYKKGKEILKKINIEIPENKISVFLGHNGVGKTTLFLLISGHLKLKKGQIIFNSDLVCERSQIAFVPESGGFFDSLSVMENLKFFYLLSNCPENKLKERINLYIRLFELTDYEKIIGKKLSYGLKKRLSIACALICERKVLLLDEPTNGVDPVTHKLLINIFKQLRNKGVHILINSHDLLFVSKVADQIAILNKGKLVFNKSTNEFDINLLEKIYFYYTEKREEIPYEEL